MHRCLSTW